MIAAWHSFASVKLQKYENIFKPLTYLILRSDPDIISIFAIFTVDSCPVAKVIDGINVVIEVHDWLRRDAEVSPEFPNLHFVNG